MFEYLIVEVLLVYQTLGMPWIVEADEGYVPEFSVAMGDGV